MNKVVSVLAIVAIVLVVGFFLMGGQIELPQEVNQFVTDITRRGDEVEAETPEEVSAEATEELVQTNRISLLDLLAEANRIREAEAATRAEALVEDAESICEHVSMTIYFPREVNGNSIEGAKAACRAAAAEFRSQRMSQDLFLVKRAFWAGLTSPSQAAVATEEPTAPPSVASLATATPQAPVAPMSGAGSFQINLDDDAQLCNTVCTWDIGVNVYPDGTTAQVGFAWGEAVSWAGNRTTAEYGFVRLQPGWYNDLSIKNGGVYVYNVTSPADEELIETLTMTLVSAVFNNKPVIMPSFEQIPVWASDRPSISNSASGPAGVGDGTLYPQLDGQQFSCSPENSPCTLDIIVTSNQMGIVFGVQVEWQDLAGPATDDFDESTTDPSLRCDLIVLAEGEYPGLVINDGRVEVYNLPATAIEGWRRNLIAERAEEQHINYGCPQHEAVEIWSPLGVLNEYRLSWSVNHETRQPDATATGPFPVGTTAEAQVAPATSTPSAVSVPVATPTTNRRDMATHGEQDADGNTYVAFEAGEPVVGAFIRLTDGRTCQDCYTVAPVAGRVYGGVVNPWQGEIGNREDAFR